MQKQIIFYLFLAFWAVPGYLQAATECQQWFAKIVSVQGQVDVKYLDQSKWETAPQDGELCYGDSIRTAKHSRVVLKFSNQAVATIEQNATLIFPAPEKKAKSWFLKLLEGSIFFRGRKGQQLDINTPFLNAVHKGTEFMVTVGKDNTHIAVFDGEVAASNTAGQILIKQGFSGGAQRNQAPQIYALKVSPENAVQWTLYYPPIADYQGQALSTAPPFLQPALHAYQQGKVSLALELLENTASIKYDVQTELLTASLLLTIGRVDEAQWAINQSLKVKPNNAMALALQSIIAVAHNQHQRALMLAQKAVALQPQLDAAYIALSYAQQSQFNLDAALQAAQRASIIAPTNALAWARLAELQLSVADRPAALQSAQKAQALNPNLAKIYIIRGFSDIADNHIEAGKQAFIHAIRIDSSDPIARLGLAVVKIRQGYLEAGKSDLEIAVNLDPNNAILRSYLGKSFYELKNKEYAAKEFDIAKVMDSKDPTPWFYDAILKQTTNRPVEALHDMQKAIELNHNRGVYRSSLLLDKDLAARSAAQGRIYNELGFQQQGFLQGWRSVNKDQNNYSAHRLLADNYAVLPRHEVARVSELLQSQLLQPVNITPIQPHLAETNLFILNGLGASDLSYNEFNPLYEYNRLALQASGIYAGNNTWGDNIALSGIKDNFSFSLGHFHYQTDGFRENNFLKKKLYNAFVQAQVTDKLNLQAELRYEDRDNGDLSQNFYNTYSQADYQKNHIATYRVGGRYVVSPFTSWIGSFFYQDINSEKNFVTDVYSSLTHLKSEGFISEIQHSYKNSFLSVINGFGYINHSSTSQSVTGFNSIPEPPINDSTTRTNFYNYSKFNINAHLLATVGVSFDFFTLGDFTEIKRVNPKLGIEWSPISSTVFRVAAFRGMSMTRIASQTIEPTQIAGFNQFFDDVNGTVAWRFGVGVDHKISKNLATGLEYSERKLNFPAGKSVDRSEQLGRAYLNFTPTDKMSISGEYFYERIDQSNRVMDSINGLFHLAETHRIPLTISFFHPSGLSFKIKNSFVHQSGFFKEPLTCYFCNNSVADSSTFFLVDLNVAYRFPKRYGMISFGVNNVFNKSFNYQNTSPLLNEAVLFPERLIFSKITLAF